MKFLSIDFSTQNTGYTFQDNDGNYVVGQIPVSNTKVKSPYERTQLIIEALSDMIIEYNLMDRLIAIEEPIIVFKNSMSLIRSNGMVLGALRQKFNMGFIDVPNVKWASYHLIKGNNKKGKLAISISHIISIFMLQSFLR